MSDTPDAILAAWRVRDFAAGEADIGQVQAAGTDGPEWIDVALPDDIYLALHRAGRLPDPFYGDNEAACAWVQHRAWWWVCAFTPPAVPPGEGLRLLLRGLDTFASIYLNGMLLGRSSNMFCEVAFDIGTLVTPGGANHLAICFEPASAAAAVVGAQLPAWPIISDAILATKRNYIRKAQFGWGWDWAPCLPTVGIWQPVELHVQRAARLASVRFSTQRLAPAAAVRVDVEIDEAAGGAHAGLQAEITLQAPGGQVAATRLVAVQGGTLSASFDIENPALWWTPELGGQPLYTLTVGLLDERGTLDSAMQRVGLRTIELDVSDDPDQAGTSFFRFVLNGVPIFARGACWVPASSFVGAVKDADYRRLVAAAAAANMNMLRVWGGGVYEPQAFYDACDELGILVWQDFMFACAPYPQDDPAFVDNVRAELHYQVKRLRSHACLALWCGNNESQALHGFLNRMQGRQDALPGALFYTDIMPAIVAELDPATPYWPGSPTGGPSDNSMRAGDVHSWTVWHGLPPVPDMDPVGGVDRSPAGVSYTRYAEEMGRFVSEFGIQAAPSMQTLRRSLPPGALALGSAALLSRIKDKPEEKVDAMLLPVTGLPRTLEDYVDYTQIVQAEGLKFGIEHLRRRKPHCSGALIWQFNDCWPGVSWSILDYYGFGKAAYYYTARAYAPVLASFRQADGMIELWITNDTAQPVSATAVIELAHFTDGPLWTVPCAFTMPAGGSCLIWQKAAADMGGAPGCVVLTVRAADDIFPANRLFFAPLKDLNLPAGAPPAVSISTAAAGTLTIDLTAHAYLQCVHILAPHGWLRYSDNFFDMRAGETRRITIHDPASLLTEADVTVASR